MIFIALLLVWLLLMDVSGLNGGLWFGLLDLRAFWVCVWEFVVCCCYLRGLVGICFGFGVVLFDTYGL